ncbi:hypothetical protein GCM10009603_16430 [Nocardiopsis exhalans]
MSSVPFGFGRLHVATAFATDTTDRAVLALHSAIRRRGVAAMDGEQTGEVRAEHGGRCIVVRLSEGLWVSVVDGGGRTAPIGREGGEEPLARWLTGELLGRI